MRSFRTYGIFLAAGIVAACGSVSGNDSAFWHPGQNLGSVGTGGGSNGTGGSSSGTGGSSSGTGGNSSSTGGSSTGTGGNSSSTGGSSSGTGGSSSGTGGSSSGTGGSSGGPTMCQFTFNMTQHSYGGRYSPRNVSAIWIEGPSNQFIKTLSENGFIRYRYLYTWTKSSNLNTVDAVTGATQSSSTQPHSVKWNCTDTSEKPVPNGTYHIYFEYTEDDAEGQVGHVDFQVGKAQNLTPPDQQYFTNMSLTMK